MRALGAFHAAMSGSGSAVFGLFLHPLSTHDLKGWPAEKVAEGLGMSRNAVHISKTRVLSHLRKLRPRIAEVW